MQESVRRDNNENLFQGFAQSSNGALVSWTVPDTPPGSSRWLSEMTDVSDEILLAQYSGHSGGQRPASVNLLQPLGEVTSFSATNPSYLDTTDRAAANTNRQLGALTVSASQADTMFDL